jgi:phosphoglycerate dehydrogenase-like enzyme
MSENHLPLVILNQPYPDEWLAALEGRVNLVVGPPGREGWHPDLDEHLPEAEGLLSSLSVPVDEAFLDGAPKLRVVSNVAVGVNNVDLDACTRRGIPVGHTPGLLTAATADLTVALTLAAARRLPQAARAAKDGEWTYWDPAGFLGLEMEGATVGIIGFGRIGQAAGRRLRGFGVDLVYHTRHRRPEAEEAVGARWTSFEDLLTISDIVILLVPLTDETHHMIDAAALRRMKETAILINVARGPVVDPDALLQALDEGWIGAAGLDVTEPEPLPAEHPLYAQENCFILPHIGSATEQTRRGMARLACANLLAGLAGEPLPHLANPEVDYP